MTEAAGTDGLLLTAGQEYQMALAGCAVGSEIPVGTAPRRTCRYGPDFGGDCK